MRFAYPILSILLFCVGLSARASSLDANTLKELTQLEQKYFSITYDRELDEDRTARLEKLIYGSTMDGDPGPRIQNIYSATSATAAANPQDNKRQAVPEVPAMPETPQPAPSRNFSSAAPAPASKPSVTQRQPEPMDDQDDPTDNTADGYPRITLLEKTILGKSFQTDKLPARFARMETKAFGHQSASTDLSERTDTLEQYAEKTLHLKAQQDEDSGEVNMADSSKPTSAYPHITSLETAILGQTYESELPGDRLSRMETKAFGAPTQSTDLATRTDALENYAEKKLHKKTQQNETADADGSRSQRGGGGGGGLTKTIAQAVGNSLLSMVGGGPGIGGPGMSPGGMMGGGYPMGRGMGMGGFGMGPSRMRQRTQNDVQPQEIPPEVDPLIASATPPPSSARTLTKVGWCEMQVFGQTFPKMHLPDRLGKLNREITFEPNKSDLELMDDIPKLVSAVQARKIGGHAIGANPGAGVH
jgi:hypothetical protein